MNTVYSELRFASIDSAYKRAPISYFFVRNKGVFIGKPECDFLRECPEKIVTTKELKMLDKRIPF